MSGTGQPDALPSHRLRVDGVVCVEAGGGYAATNIITAPGHFTLRTEFGFDGDMDTMILGDEYRVMHHWQRVEDGAIGYLPLQEVRTVAEPLSHIRSVSQEYSTGPGGDLPVAPNFSTGTYRIFTHIHFLPPNNHTHAGFYDGLVIMVVP